MTEIGEGVSITMFTNVNEEHSEKTCPWHKKEAAKKVKNCPSTIPIPTLMSYRQTSLESSARIWAG
ncbi:MAG: hypothetical protein P8X89_21470 [Reinekea sp.]